MILTLIGACSVRFIACWSVGVVVATNVLRAARWAVERSPAEARLATREGVDIILEYFPRLHKQAQGWVAKVSCSVRGLLWPGSEMLHSKSTVEQSPNFRLILTTAVLALCTQIADTDKKCVVYE